MAASSFGAFITLDSKSQPPRRPEPVQKAPAAHELDELKFGARYNGPPSREAASRTPVTSDEADVESIARPSPSQSTHAVQSLSNPPMNKYRFSSVCLMSLSLGLNDSAVGALIPYVEAHYAINYGTVSLVFVTNAIGFVLAAPLTNLILAKMGRSNLLALSQALMLAAYIILVCTPPFAVVVLSFFFSGLGMAFSLALNNTFTAGLVNGTTLLGLFHGCYGLGGILGPLIATALVTTGRSWSTYYLIPLALACVNCVAAFWTFRNYEAELTQPLLSEQGGEAPSQSPPTQHQSMRSLLETFASRITLLGALFIFAYQGAEVSISGWVLSFLLTSRAHPESQTPSLGYVSSGFWAGITLGRFLLSNPAQRIGEKLSVFVLIAGSAAFQLLVWLVPNIIGNAVAVAIVGLLLGPIYPCATIIFSRLLSRGQLVSALAAISAFGSSGGAVAPLVTGLIGQQEGPWVLNPIVIGLFGGMVICWASLPKAPKRTE